MELTAAPSCPKCGAAAADAKAGSAYTCPFCNEISVMAPPPLELISRVVMVDAAGRTSLKCPRCALALYEGTVGDTTMHGCGQCGGVWLDNIGSQTVVNVGPSPLVAMAERASHARHSPVDELAPANCPFDGTTLRRTNVRGIDVDACPSHGTWFDAGEVRRIANIYNAERMANAGGATHDYELDAKESADNAHLAMSFISALLAPTSRR